MAREAAPPFPDIRDYDHVVCELREDRREEAKNFAGNYAEDLCFTNRVDSRRLEQAADHAEALASACREEAARMRYLEGEAAIIPNLKKLIRKLKGLVS